MAQVIATGIIAFLFLHLAYGQDACTAANKILAANAATCTPTANNPQIFCSGQCRSYYDDLFNNCAPDVSLHT